MKISNMCNRNIQYAMQRYLFLLLTLPNLGCNLNLFKSFLLIFIAQQELTQSFTAKANK